VPAHPPPHNFIKMGAGGLAAFRPLRAIGMTRSVISSTSRRARIDRV